MPTTEEKSPVVTLPRECDFILIDIECDDECGQADCVTCVV